MTSRYLRRNSTSVAAETYDRSLVVSESVNLGPSDMSIHMSVEKSATVGITTVRRHCLARSPAF